MCGFLGWAQPGKDAFDLRVLDRARDTMRHRGPDEARSIDDGFCYLGFRRLAIVDLSEQGSQPMCSIDNSAWIVFNGEIYNHVELRDALKNQGIQFRGT